MTQPPYKRHFPDWLSAFQDYASFGEAPRRMYFFVGLATMAGALRRHVWIDQYYFKWHTNLYTILVAPPGVVAKTTTADIGMDLLRRVPGIQFGPSVCSWQALVKGFGDSAESFLHEPSGEYHTHSPMTISSGEFGNLLNPQDKEMVDMLVNLWDGKGFRKISKHAGNDDVVNPWINIIACTTPAWIAGNFPEYMIGGGFTSRCIFVYADAKERFVAYPGLSADPKIGETADKLVADLEHIATKLVGEYKLQPEAIEWGKDWYVTHNTSKPKHLQDDRFGGYLARKQTFLHKIAMLLAASKRDELYITRADLEIANLMVTDLEFEMINVFKKIGRSDLSLAGDRLLSYIKLRGDCPYAEAYRYIHAQFPAFRDFEDVLKGLIQAGYLTLIQTGGVPCLRYNQTDEKAVPVAGE
jgi:hypothetical protein